MTSTIQTQTATDARWERAETLEALAFQLLELAREHRSAARFGEGDWGHVGDLGYAIEQAENAVKHLGSGR
jgi:hypothetical protein